MVNESAIIASQPRLSGVRRALVEFLWFGLKEARACLFAGLFFLAVFGLPRGGFLGWAVWRVGKKEDPTSPAERIPGPIGAQE